MANFFSKLFGLSNEKKEGTPEELLQSALDGILDQAHFDLIYELTNTGEGFFVQFSGGDSKLLTEKDGLVLDAFQTYLKRLLQNRFPKDRIEITVDCEGFLDSSAEELRTIADRLKNLVLKKGQPAYVRALPPRDRKIIHRHLAEDGRVRSQSVGEGFCKKIKITSSRPMAQPSRDMVAESPQPEGNLSAW
jgi:spoIIIJ-associated protein